MIIISIIEDQIHIAPLLKDKTLDYNQRIIINAASASALTSAVSITSSAPASASASVAAAAVTAGELYDARQKIIVSCGTRLLEPNGATAVFIDERKSYFAALKDPRLDDKLKLDDYIKWNVRQNCNIDNFEYSHAPGDEGLIYASAVCAKRVAAAKNAMTRFADKIICMDTHLFNEINHLKTLGLINNDDRDFALLKLCGDYASITRFAPGAGFERLEFDFMCKVLLCDYKVDQSGYGTQELMLMHEMIKIISRWQPNFSAPKQKPAKLFLLNAAGGQAPYYLRLRIAEELTDNLYYVNMSESVDNFNYADFNLEAMCGRWK